VTGRTWTSNGALILDEPFVPIVFKWLFGGRVDSKTETTLRGDDTATVRCVDRFADYAAIDFDASAPQGAGEDTRARMDRILTNAGSPPLQPATEIGTPQYTMQSTTLAKQMLSEMYLTMESEGGDMWMNQSNVLQVGYRDWLTVGGRQTVVTATFGGMVGLGVTSGKPSQDLQLVVNVAVVANAGGTEQTSSDSESVARYGRRTFRRNDLLGDQDTQSQFLANRTVTQLADSRPRIRNVDIQVSADALGFAGALLTGDLVQVTVDSIFGHSETFQAHVIGFTHSVFENQWNISLTLDDAFVNVGEGGGFDNTAFSDGFDTGSA